MHRPHLALIFLSIGTLAGLSLNRSVTATSPTSEEDELLRNATLVFSRAVDTPAAAIPAAVLIRASGIAVIPAATGQSNRYHGRGILSARGARPDDWTPPAVIDFEGAIPFDLEAGPIDVVLVAQTRRGLDSLVQERSSREIARPTAPGALGHSSPAGINADVLTYMQFAQYFAGVTVTDWVVQEVKASNAILYGRPYSTDDIVRGAGFFHLPYAARMWRDAIADYFREMS
jgi:lipid-binding SYLF domain-containing protein